MTSILDKIKGKTDDISQGVVETTEDLAGNKHVKSVLDKTLAVTSSIENVKNPVQFAVNPETGTFDKQYLATNLIRSLTTLPSAQEKLEKFVTSEAGEYIPIVEHVPLAKALIAKTPGVNILAEELVRKSRQAKFDNAKAIALQEAARGMDTINKANSENQVQFVGADVVERLLANKAKYAPKSEFDKTKLLNEALILKAKLYNTPASKEEATAIKQAIDNVYDKGFAKKGLDTVYARKQGGLQLQRYKAGLNEVQSMRDASSQRYQAGVTKAQDARNVMEQIMNTESPIPVSSEGPQFNFTKLKDYFTNSKVSSCHQALQELVDKVSAINGTYSSYEDFIDVIAPEIGKETSLTTRILTKRNLDNQGGAHQYINDLANKRYNAFSGSDNLNNLQAMTKRLKELNEKLSSL